MSQYDDDYNGWYWDEEMEAEYRASIEREVQAKREATALTDLGAKLNKLKQEQKS